MSDHALLPFVDAWSVDVDAPPRTVWQALLERQPPPHAGGWRRLWAIAWAADPAASNGLAAHVLGAERPGFEVREVVPPATYALAGRHRFAQYQLVFRIEGRGPAGSRLTAETFARFPGTAGRLYRALLIDAGLHALVMWTMVRALRRRAEARARREANDA